MRYWADGQGSWQILLVRVELLLLWSVCVVDGVLQLQIRRPLKGLLLRSFRDRGQEVK